MNNYNSKTCDYDKFKEYISQKNELNNKLFGVYNNTDYFKKLNWYSYINTKRSDANLVQLIKNTYGSDIIIIIGDWSVSKQMRNFMSTPNLGLKRVLSSEFTVYNVDEFRTSCLNYKTEERCENLYLPDARNKKRKIHAILTYQMENKRKGCINRDKNGVNNIRKVVKYYLETGERLPKFSRETKEIKKSSKVIPVKKASQIKQKSLKLVVTSTTDLGLKRGEPLAKTGLAKRQVSIKLNGNTKQSQ